MKSEILHIVTHKEVGGAQTVALCLHQYFLKNNYNSRLYALYEKGEFDEEMKVLSKEKGMLRILIRFIQLLWNQPSDSAIILHTHYSTTFGYLITKFFSFKKILCVLHNPYDEYPAITRFVYKYLVKIISKDEYIAVSKSIKDGFVKNKALKDEQIEVIYNPINFKNLKKASTCD